ncbi:DUF3106 domain-containing protein [Variovorax sp. HJSM1_2]|uniref:DUF3106 domain-containing protein n=1 Tax=Variovorax sp. HJSM1_2 TaxID=3366263 RepID=UPI003BC9BB1E
MSRSISRAVGFSAHVEFPSTGFAPLTETRPLQLYPRLFAAALCCTFLAAQAQDPAKTQASAAPSAVKAPVAAPRASAIGPQWHELSTQERRALAPLQASWGGISEGHKRKWMALSARFDKLSPEEQQKLQERMTEWAGLSVAERNRARLNFAETKRLDPTEKQAKWEAYQALSEDEKHKLAEQAPKPPAGAAPAVRSVTRPKLANTYAEQKPGQPVQLTPPMEHRNVDPTTLLPQQP